MNYVKRLRRESGVNGNLRFVLMMIAQRIPKGYIESRPTSIAWLSRTTGLDDRTVRTLRDRLVHEFRKVKIGQAGRGRGRFHTFILPELAGPLFVVAGDVDAEPLKPDRSPGIPGEYRARGKPDQSPGFPRGKPDHSPGFKPDRSPGFPEKPDQSPGFCGENRGFFSDLSSCDLSTTYKNTTTTTTTPVTKVERVEAAFVFLDWWQHTYPTHNGGARTTVDLEYAGPIVERLLLTWPLERLQAMAVVLWTVTVDEDRFLASTDRSLKVLKHAADRLDRIVVKRAASPAVQAAATVFRRDRREAQLEEVRRLLQEHVDDVHGHARDALGRACAAALVALQAPDPDFERIDEALLLAALDVVDVTACEADAQAELREYVGRMPVAQYDRSLRALTEREVRRRARLPELSGVPRAKAATA